MKDQIRKQLEESGRLKEKVARELSAEIEKAGQLLITALKNEAKLLVFGNGGSAADAQHFVCELVGRFAKNRKPIAAIALSTNTSSLTAIGNDFGFEHTFARQVEALGKPGDVCFALSTSGQALNVIKAAKTARAMGLKVIGLTGKDGGQLKSLCDLVLRIPSQHTWRIQECHITIIHILCHLIEESLFAP